MKTYVNVARHDENRQDAKSAKTRQEKNKNCWPSVARVPGSSSWRLLAGLGVLAVTSLVSTLAATLARADEAPPPALAGVAIEERPGAEVPRDVALRGADGREVRLGSLFAGDARPAVLVLYYDRCPMLCGLVLAGACAAFRAQDGGLGARFRAVAVSVDPRDRPEDARRREALELERAGLAPEAAGGPAPGSDASPWRFLVGDAAAVDALARAVGFGLRRDPATGEIAHPAALIVLTPDGRVSRYLYGVEFDARDLRLALAEAAAGRAGAPTPLADRALMQCYRWNPTTRRYEVAVARFLRAGGVLILAGLALFFRRLLREGRRRG